MGVRSAWALQKELTSQWHLGAETASLWGAESSSLESGFELLWEPWWVCWWG